MKWESNCRGYWRASLHLNLLQGLGGRLAQRRQAVSGGGCQCGNGGPGFGPDNTEGQGGGHTNVKHGVLQTVHKHRHYFGRHILAHVSQGVRDLGRTDLSSSLAASLSAAN